MSLTPMNNADMPQESKASQTGRERAGENTQHKSRLYATLIAIALVLGTSEGIYAWWLTSRIQKMERSFQAQITTQDEGMHRIGARLGMAEDQYSDLQGTLSSTRNNLDKTQADLRRTRVAADQLAKQQKEAAEQFSGQIGDLQQAQTTASGTLGTLSSDVTGVKQEVSATKNDLASTRSDLQRVIGDLGVQSGLVARNRDELAELRQRGERDYFEFDLRKNSKPQKLANGIALQLKKTDPKRQKFTVDLVTDDRRIEKKDRTANEPVQFYQQGYRQPTELVVNQVEKDRIVGYVSTPKQSRVATAQSPGSGS